MHPYHVKLAISHSSTVKDWATIIFSAVGTYIAIAAYVQAKERFFPKNESDILGYQAIFLTNSQVYFGKIVASNKDFVKLKYIYYLQTAPSDANTVDVTSLVKLGNEIHGPDDTMFINRNQILYWEHLKEHGQVVKAIKDYEKSLL